MRDLLTAPADAYAPDADRAGPDASAQLPEWLVHCLVAADPLLAPARARRSLAPFPPAGIRGGGTRPDLPAGSVQAQAASIRGPFGRSIAWMCRRHGIGPGHQDWPELSRAIVAFGGSLKGFRAGAPALGLQWWENPNVVPGMGWLRRARTRPQRCCSGRLLRMLRRRRRTPCGPKPRMPRLPASWLAASARQVLARAGPSPSTGPPGCPGLPNLSCLTHGAGARLAPPY